jgi:hypothetical protein
MRNEVKSTLNIVKIIEPLLSLIHHQKYRKLRVSASYELILKIDEDEVDNFA